MQPLGPFFLSQHFDIFLVACHLGMKMTFYIKHINSTFYFAATEKVLILSKTKVTIVLKIVYFISWHILYLKVNIRDRKYLCCPHGVISEYNYNQVLIIMFFFLSSNTLIVKTNLIYCNRHILPEQRIVRG